MLHECDLVAIGLEADLGVVCKGNREVSLNLLVLEAQLANSHCFAPLLACGCVRCLDFSSAINRLSACMCGLHLEMLLHLLLTMNDEASLVSVIVKSKGGTKIFLSIHS